MAKDLIDDCETLVDLPRRTRLRERRNNASEKQYNLNYRISEKLTSQRLQANDCNVLKMLPVLKNGSCTDRLYNGITQNSGTIVIRNTCAFDTVTSIFMAAYSDSLEYNTHLNVSDNPFLNFVMVLVRKGITSRTYSTRTELMINILQPNLKINFNTTLANFETTISSLVNCALKDFPTAIESTSCNARNCKQAKGTTRSITFISYTSTTSDLKGLQMEISSRIQEEKTKCKHVNNNKECKGLQTKVTKLSPLHLFIDVFNWRGNNEICESEAIPPLKIAIQDVPEVLVGPDITYKLRGIGCFRRCKSNQRTSIGHYFACCKRSSGDWEVYDDLRRGVKCLRPTALIPCEFIMYTI